MPLEYSLKRSLRLLLDHQGVVEKAEGLGGTATVYAGGSLGQAAAGARVRSGTSSEELPRLFSGVDVEHERKGATKADCKSGLELRVRGVASSRLGIAGKLTRGRTTTGRVPPWGRSHEHRCTH